MGCFGHQWANKLDHGSSQPQCPRRMICLRLQLSLHLTPNQMTMAVTSVICATRKFVLVMEEPRTSSSIEDRLRA